MNIEAEFAQVIGQRYDLTNFVLYPIIQEEGRQLHRLDRENAQPWLLRAYSYPNSDTRQAQYVHVLELLQKHEYAAPRLIRTREGEAITKSIIGENQWYLVLTTFIEGEVIDGDGPDELRLIGEALGHLHTFSNSLPSSETQILSAALWRPEEIIPLAIQELALIKEMVPTTEQSAYEAIQEAIASLPEFSHLPWALNHGDCVPTNAVMTSDQQVVLIDWADAGSGALILDFAWLLIMGMGGIPNESSQSTKAEVDPARLRAVVAGYCHYRIPTMAERAVLLDAIRFVPAFSAALEFCSACRHESPSAIWQGWWERYEVAPMAAALVEEYIER